FITTPRPPPRPPPFPYPTLFRSVPAGQPTIQAAINAASNGDTVLVAPGTYHENINFMGKGITVTSSGGPSVTTIDGGRVGTVVRSEEHTSELQSRFDLVCRLLLE